MGGLLGLIWCACEWSKGGWGLIGMRRDVSEDWRNGAELFRDMSCCVE